MGRSVETSTVEKERGESNHRADYGRGLVFSRAKKRFQGSVERARNREVRFPWGGGQGGLEGEGGEIDKVLVVQYSTVGTGYGLGVVGVGVGAGASEARLFPQSESHITRRRRRAQKPLQREE